MKLPLKDTRTVAMPVENAEEIAIINAQEIHGRRDLIPDRQNVTAGTVAIYNS